MAARASTEHRLAPRFVRTDGTLGDMAAAPRLASLVIPGGVLHLDQCRALAITEDHVRWLLESRRWQRVYPRVYATSSGPISQPVRVVAALFYCGSGAMLSHQSAGALWRLCHEPPAIHVTVPYPRQVDAQPGLRIHRSRTATDSDAHPTFVPRRTRIERTVLDLLTSCRTGEAALALVADALRGRATTAERLRTELAENSCTRWRKVVLDALPDLRAGAQSILELRDAAIRRAHGLPRGERQARRLTDGTEYLDVLIEEWRLHIELDGRLGHDRAREIWRDMKRDNRSVLTRLRVLRYGWADLVDRPCEVAIEQAVVLRQQGWPGEFRRCRNCPQRLPAGL